MRFSVLGFGSVLRIELQAPVVKVTSSYHVAFQRIQELLGAFFKHENAIFNGDPGDGFSYPTLTLMMDSYTLAYQIRYSNLRKRHKQLYFFAHARSICLSTMQMNFL